jgi:antitoxin (DNA-binding transcriptional repressor) of toxin-antitoxin stability system
MKRINIHDAKTHLSRYLEDVERGETFLVCRRNAPVAELRPVRRERTKPRPVGLGKGTLRVPAVFFKPLPRDLLDAFEGKGR